MRRAKLALHLPQQVREFAARVQAFHQRRIAGVETLPIHASHISHPELLALQTPRLAEHLAPLGAWVDRNLDALQVKPA